MFFFSCSGMFRNVPECSGMFRHVPCSGFYRRPNIYGLIVILLFLGQAHCEKGKNYRCRKIQIFTSQFADFANTDFHFLSQIAVSLFS